ncbi:farnesol dehydrogenase-like [Lucilia cuprina]|uniref:farnesol dehydrogenase-like n=1 Tax=Lucilia cuprina TaxID=7375 RepID=UPI001F068BDF|nr:farnesol dehydrogenase-like [Lucilia cuprina]
MSHPKQMPLKIAVITGASSGIGAACCKALLQEGMIVVGLARRQDQMEREVLANIPADQRYRFHALKCDVRSENDIRNTFAWIADHLGGIDVLINNAGVLKNTQIVKPNNTEDLRDVLDTNILGVALCTREAFAIMKNYSRDTGHVIIINSLVGHYVPQLPGVSLNLYAPTKYALTAMTEVLRQEFLMEQTKIKITSISPGAVNTQILGECSNLPAEYSLLRPQDVADAVVYCLQTPPNVQIHELMIRPLGGTF